jgi:hypothetical protein
VLESVVARCKIRISTENRKNPEMTVPLSLILPVAERPADLIDVSPRLLLSEWSAAAFKE